VSQYAKYSPTLSDVIATRLPGMVSACNRVSFPWTSSHLVPHTLAADLATPGRVRRPGGQGSQAFRQGWDDFKLTPPLPIGVLPSQLITGVHGLSATDDRGEARTRLVFTGTARAHMSSPSEAAEATVLP
jgi:hypothetical protein